MKYLLTALTWLVALPLAAVPTYFAMIFLAGPHAGLLPHFLEPWVLVSGWLVVIVVPIVVARVVWRRFSKGER